MTVTELIFEQILPIRRVKYFEETLEALTFGFIQPRACPVAYLKKC